MTPGLLFLIAWAVVWWLLVFRWKSVRLEGTDLVVSNYLKKARIPVTEISWIEGSSWWGWQPQTVRISFRWQTAFGNEIVFVPAGGWISAEKWADSLRAQLGIQSTHPHH